MTKKIDLLPKWYQETHYVAQQTCIDELRPVIDRLQEQGMPVRPMIAALGFFLCNVRGLPEHYDEYYYIPPPGPNGDTTLSKWSGN